MKAYWGVLIFIAMAGTSGLANSQSLQCIGSPIVEEKPCPACPNSYQSASSHTCTTPTDLQGKKCGSQTCEAKCGCQPVPANDAMTGNAAWIGLFIKNENAKGNSSPRTSSPAPAPRTSAPSQPSNGRPQGRAAITGVGLGPRVRPAEDVSSAGGARVRSGPVTEPARTLVASAGEVRTCLKAVDNDYGFGKTPAENWMQLTIKNICTRCLSTRIEVKNAQGERGRYGNFQVQSNRMVMRPNVPVILRFNVDDGTDWIVFQDFKWYFGYSEWASCP